MTKIKIYMKQNVPHGYTYTDIVYDYYFDIVKIINDIMLLLDNANFQYLKNSLNWLKVL